jgi:hypothetical protein
MALFAPMVPFKHQAESRGQFTLYIAFFNASGAFFSDWGYVHEQRAAAICEAVTRPSMRFVKIRSVGNQAALMRHKVRETLVDQRTQIFNCLRGNLAEIGVIAAQGPGHVQALAALLCKGDPSIPSAVVAALLPWVT